MFARVLTAAVLAAGLALPAQAQSAPAAAPPAVAPSPAPAAPSPAPPAPSPAPSPSTARRGTVSFEYSTPAGWRRMSAGAKTVFVIVDAPSKVHTLAFTGTSTADDLETFTAALMKKASVHGETIEDEWPSTSCGSQTAHRFTVHSLTASGAAMVTHYLVTPVYGGMGTGVYVHAAATGPRQDGLDELAKLCPGSAPPQFPAGWTRPKVPGPMGTTATSPDLSSSFFTAAIPLNASAVPAYEQRNAIAGDRIADRTEPCLSGTVHRMDIRSGGQIAETATAYLHGFEYRSVYTRPAAHDADPSAERMLTTFCRPVDPNAAPAA